MEKGGEREREKERERDEDKLFIHTETYNISEMVMQYINISQKYPQKAL